MQEGHEQDGDGLVEVDQSPDLLVAEGVIWMRHICAGGRGSPTPVRDARPDALTLALNGPVNLPRAIRSRPEHPSLTVSPIA